MPTHTFSSLQILAAAVLLAGPAGATIIFNGTPSPNGPALAIGGNHIGAESITLAGSLNVISFEFSAQGYNPPAAIDFSIYSDNGSGRPINLLASGTGALVSETQISPSFSVVSVNMSAHVALTAGTYWLGLNVPSASLSMAWGSTNTGSNLSAVSIDGGNSWLLNADQIFLGLSNVPLATTPEPESILLAGLGLAGLAWARMRRTPCQNSSDCR